MKEILRLILPVFFSSIPRIRALSNVPSHIPIRFEHTIASESSITHARNSITATPLISFVRDWLIEPVEAVAPPSKSNIVLLQQAMTTFYAQPPNYAKAQDLLTQTIEVWNEQPVDELAALYRVRGDCQMFLLSPNKARDDYTKAIQLLQGPGGEKADPMELPTSFLGRARAIRSENMLEQDQSSSLKAAKDYQMSLRLSSREQWDTDREKEQDGVARNPFAAWEWGTSLRNAGLYTQAAEVHALASQSFDDIGDRPRAVISQIDSGIDLVADAASSQNSKYREEGQLVLSKAIARSKGVESRDIALLQHVIAKEGEGRMALASILWSNPQQRSAAEKELGEACSRMEQLQVDATARAIKSANKSIVKKEPTSFAMQTEKLKFSIDDQPGAFDISCSRFKNKKFLADTLQWPVSLQEKVQKLEKLG